MINYTILKNIITGAREKHQFRKDIKNTWKTIKDIINQNNDKQKYPK